MTNSRHDLVVLSDSVTIILGDCREVLPTLGPVDAVVTDPPAGISFMGKTWDTDHGGRDEWVARFAEIARLALACCKPGAHALVWAIPRTSHWTATAWENGGWEVRDRISHAFGSGFPKSLDVSKAIDRMREDDPAWLKVTSFLREARDKAGLTTAQVNEHFGYAAEAKHWFTSASQPHLPPWEDWTRLKALLRFDDSMDAEVWRLNGRKGQPGDAWAEREVVGQHAGEMGGLGGERLGQTGGNITAPATNAARQWAGWGTALKPAIEDWWLLRRPLIGTVAENVLAHGTGAINVDGCRVGTDERPNREADRGRISGNSWQGGVDGSLCGSKANGTTTQGRWPANLIHDGSDEVVGLFPVTTSGKLEPHHNRSEQRGVYGKYSGKEWTQPFGGDTGSAARFFYCAKASKADRDEGCEGLEAKEVNRYGEQGQGPLPQQTPRVIQQNRNHHPTVKPTALMRYLCRLVTPPGGVVLDQFMGSGSTGKAAILEGFPFIGIERDRDSFEIAKARLTHAIAERRQRLDNELRQGLLPLTNTVLSENNN